MMRLQQYVGNQRSLLLALVTILMLGWSGPAQARAAGFATASCDSCHRGGQIPKVTITLEPTVIDPGGTTTVTVAITAVNGGPAGFYLHARGLGTFQDIPGSGTRLPTSTEVVHSMPKSQGAVVTFQTRWTAPAKAGSYSFEALGVSANGNNQPIGDGASTATLFFTVGCAGIPVYVDFDGDGYGSDAIGPSRACDLQPGFVLKGGDCNDYRATVHPGAPEICDEYDNDCNGQVNEGLESAMVYLDSDGDGHGSRYTADTHVGCGMPGYATLHDDCNDADKNVYPGAKEICNNKDDNCNGRVDEGARLSCGIGLCRSVADSCAATACTPGMPRAELCNFVDDDCDGVIDDDAPCEEGRVCVTGRCLKPDDAKAVMEAQRMDGGAGTDGGGGGGGGAGSDGGAASAEHRRSRPGCHYGPVAGELPGAWLLAGLGAGVHHLWRRRRRAP
jgi:hypothetical protein